MQINIPSNWSKRGNAEELFFEDESKATTGGIATVGFYGELESALPNHSEIIENESIEIHSKKGKLITLKTDSPAASENNKTDYETHIVIPADQPDMAYDFWIKGKNKDVLINMLKN